MTVARILGLFTATNVIYLLVAAAFGPYLVSGLRTEQLFVYAATVVGLALFAVRRQYRLANRDQVILVAPWAVLLLVAAVSWLVHSQYHGPRTKGTVDDLALPIAVSILVWVIQHYDQPESLLRSLSLAVIVALCINVAVAALQASGHAPPLISHWLPSGPSSATRSAENSRYSGVLDQPALAGVFYGIGMLMVARYFRRWTMIGLLLILLVGAMLAASKAFFLACLPAIVVSLLWHRRQARRQVIATCVGLVALAVVALILVPHLPKWPGIAQIQRTMSGGLSVANLTGNRIGGTNQVGTLAHDVLNSSPVIGWGFGGIETATDSGFVHALVVAGLLGVLCFVMIVVFPWVRWARTFRRLVPDDAVFWVAFLYIVTVGNTGFPVFVGNRLSTVVWALLAILMAQTWKASRRGKESTTVVSAPPVNVGPGAE